MIFYNGFNLLVDLVLVIIAYQFGKFVATQDLLEELKIFGGKK